MSYAHTVDRPPAPEHDRSPTGRVVVDITDLDEDGSGVGIAGGRELHVAGALPGETVSVAIEHDSPHGARSWATLVSTADLVGEPSPERVPPACPGHGRCGGCVLQHLAYPAQLTAKRRRVEQALADAGLHDPTVADVIASPHELGYRNKAKYVVAPRPGTDHGLLFGSYSPGTHSLVDMAGCQVPEPPLDAIARAAIRLAEHERTPGYDETARTGELRHLVVRANADGQVLVVLVTRTAAPIPQLRRVARALRAERPEVVGVVLHVNAGTGGAIFSSGGHEDHLLDGASALSDTVGDVTLELSARAFFQVNRTQAARIYAPGCARSISTRASAGSP
jgi:23S rRNA (uracil1939-C5)-methyltransferase